MLALGPVVSGRELLRSHLYLSPSAEAGISPERSRDSAVRLASLTAADGVCADLTADDPLRVRKGICACVRTGDAKRLNLSAPTL